MTFTMVVCLLSAALVVLWLWIFGGPKKDKSTVTEGDGLDIVLKLDGVCLVITPLWQESVFSLWLECRLTTWNREGGMETYELWRHFPLDFAAPERIYDFESFSREKGLQSYQACLRYGSRAGKRRLSVTLE